MFQVANKLNCDCAVVAASHLHSKAIFNKLGMEQLSSFLWKDYTFKGEKYFQSVQGTEGMTSHVKWFK